MIRTEDDIRQALDLEPDHDALIRLSSFAAEVGAETRVEVRTTRRRLTPARRRLMPLFAAAAIVLVAAGALALARPNSPGTPSAGQHSSAHDRRPTWDLRVGHLAGYTATLVRAVGGAGITNGATALVDATSAKRPERGGIYTCHSQRLSSCNEPTGGPREQRLTVDGRPAYFYPGRHVARDTLSREFYRRHPWLAAQRNDQSQPALSYVADPHTVVIISGTFGFRPAGYDYDQAASRRDILRIAAATSVGYQDAVRMPFALTGLPRVIAPEIAQLDAHEYCIGYGTGHPSNEFGSTLTACRVRTGPTRSATIASAPDITPHESAAIVVHDFADGTSVVVGTTRGQHPQITRRAARRLAERADVTPSLTDRATWLVVG